MFEEMTYNYILERMLKKVPDTMDKREGSIIYDAIAPAAIELTNMYVELDTIMNQTFADTATNEYLDKRCAERGITRKVATCAIVQGVFTPSNIDLIGKRFNCGDYNYIVIEENKLKCETEGSFPNGVTGQLIPIDYINGLETAEITSILIPGDDTESDDELRKRYFDSLNSQAFGGNIADYIEKTNKIDGVGGVKVTPVWNGGGTVLLTIIANDFSVPSSTLVDNVQTIIDPTQNDGEGKGIAPIGHVVTIKGVKSTSINIQTTITYEDGWNYEASKKYIEETIDAYFLDLSKEWDSSDNLVVRISAIETRLLACAGVLDVADTKLNGLTSNIQLDADCIPIRGDVIG